jgi:carbon-monoxide dehydrogenase medium subunit
MRRAGATEERATSLRTVEEFHLPDSESEVVDLLQRYGEDALLVGGGTFLHGLEARGLLAGVRALIDLQRAGLSGVRAESDGLQIGATATLRTLEDALDGSPWLGAVGDALRHPSSQIKNVATVGGSVAAACPFFDPPVAFEALDAEVVALGRGGSRVLPLPEFFTGLFKNALEVGELVTELRLPAAPDGSASGFERLQTNANDLAIISAAVRVTRGEDGTCREARVVVGGGLERPVRARSAERALTGSELTGEALRAAAEAVAEDVEPWSDHRASGPYRKAMAKVMVRRALARAVKRLS